MPHFTGHNSTNTVYHIRSSGSFPTPDIFLEPLSSFDFVCNDVDADSLAAQMNTLPGVSYQLVDEETIAAEVPPLPNVANAVLTQVAPGQAAWVIPSQDNLLVPLSLELNLTGPNLLEVGDTLNNPAFTMSYNRTPAAATLSDGVHPPITLTTPFTSGSLAHSYSKTNPNDMQVFTLAVNETNGPTKTTTVDASWQPKVYYGTATPGTIDETFVKALSSSLAPERQRQLVFNATPGQAAYYAVPVSYGGDSSSFRDAATGFPAGFSSVATVTVHNTFGVAISYNVFASNQLGLGAFTVDVS